METHRFTQTPIRFFSGVGKPLIATAVVFMIASLLASSAAAVPLSRSLQSTDAPLVTPDSSAQHIGSWSFGDEEEGDEEGRKLVGVTNDYGRTGANDKHDPPRRR